MTNRFHKLLRSLPVLAGGGLLFFLPIGLHAQVDKFNFNYTGPTTAAAGSSCTRTLASIVTPLPTVTSTVGANITMSMQDPAQTTGMYAFNAPISAPATISVGWLVKDDQAHTAHFYFTINIVDQTPPVFNLGSYPPTLTLPSVVQVPAAMNPPVTDNCTISSQINVVLTQTTPPDTCLAGTFTRTWRATDAAGNTTTFTQTININADNALPTFTNPPQSGSAPCAQLATAYPAWLAAQMTNFTVTDPSGIRSITNNGPATFPSGCAMPLTVTFQATDNCNLTLTRTATFTTMDTDPPVVTTVAKDTVGYCSGNNGHLTALNKWINKHGYQQSSDACSLPSGLTYYMRIAGVTRDSAQVVAALLASFSGGCTTKMIGTKSYDQVRGRVTVDFLVRDACGNESYAGAATFGAIDTFPPIITGVDKSEECGNANNQTLLNAWINAHGNAIATDDCSSVTWTNFSFNTSTGQTGNGTFNSGPYPTLIANDCHWYADVIFRATDQCGNIGFDTLRFRTADSTAPVISGVIPVVKVYCPVTAPVNPTATVTDNCDLSPTLTHNLPTTTLLNCSGNYNVQFIWTATDACGNTSTALQTFQVRDTTGPDFTMVPAPKTFRCDTFVLPPAAVNGVDIAADDECSVVQQNITTQIVSNQDPNPAVCGHYSYQITRIFTATDDCGNTRTATQVLTIIDNVGPVPGGVLDTTVVCGITAAVSPPTAADVCSGMAMPPVLVSRDTTAGSCANNSLITLHWRAQDVCGNTTLFNQLIHVHDTVPPTLTGIPADISVECDAIPAPPATTSFTTTDNCSQTVNITLTETETRDTTAGNCAGWTDYILHRTWTATDNCGNTTAQTQNIHIEDHSAPILVLPETLQLSNDPGDCGVALTIPAPISVYDVCTSLLGNTTQRDTAALVKSSSGPVTTTPVDTMVFQWVYANLPPTHPVVGNATLTIFLDNADSEVASESFKILGEKNVLLGTTLPTPTQCGSGSTVVTINANQLNSWLADGVLTIRLAPNGTGGNAANAICPGGRARAMLTYQSATAQVPVALTYKLDNNPTLNYPPTNPQFIGPGSHTILYTATDCAGNSSTATLIVNVQDTEPPTVYPPAPITAYVGQTNCQATVTLPFPTITDNCNVSGRISRSSAVLNLAFQNDPNAGWVPKITKIDVIGLIPNAVGSGKLTIRHKGDNADNGEFFYISDEGSPAVQLDQTTLGTTADECNQFNESIFEVAASSINAWAGTDGATFFRARPNTNVVQYSDFINPCVMPLPASMIDTASKIQAVLEYNYARINYEIRKGSVLIQSDTLRGNLTTVTLSPGVYTVKYRVMDNSGVEGMTSFLLTVRDTVKPKAFCQSKTIFTNPSGNFYTLLPSEINNNSVDNCSGTNLTFALSQTVFTCNQAPNNFPVTLTVTDTAGNSSNCTALVRVVTTILHPYYTPVCEGGTLFLFLDSVLVFGNNIYTFAWSGPNNYSSSDKNLTIINASAPTAGTYTVTVTGTSGCTATGSVTVTLLNLPNQPILNVTPAAPYCEGSNITLSTPSYSGQNVNYLWYEGDEAGATLLATTQASSFTIIQPSVNQQHKYFVKVAGNGCTSSNSAIKVINVLPRPPVSVEQENIVVCEGQPIRLGTTIMGNGIQYIWTGPIPLPNQQYVLVTSSATLAHAGQYSLVINQNGCLSETKFISVTVKSKPVQPHITANANGKVCEGATVSLVSEDYGHINYTWISPQLVGTLTTSNILTLPNLTVANSGNWRLIVETQGCNSDTSQRFPVQVQAYPDVTATSSATNGSICENKEIKLFANANTNDSLSWCWTGPNNFLQYAKTTTVSPGPGIAGQYKVVGKTTFGCSDSAFVNITVVPAPKIDTVTNDAPGCASCTTNAFLRATISPQYGPLTYQWTSTVVGFTSSDSVPTIPNVCEANNGTYYLVVKNTLGCESLPKSTTIAVKKKPKTPTVDPNLSACLGETITFHVNNAGDYIGNVVKYLWENQVTGFSQMTSQPSVTIGPINGQQMGNYTVQVMVDNCTSDRSTIMLTVKQPPLAPTPLPPNTILCEGDTLKIFANTSSADTYSWRKDPPPFMCLSPICITNTVTLQDSGLYFVRVTKDGCTSGESEPLHVQVNPRPVKPFLLPIDSLCSSGGRLKLSVLPGAAGTKYQFFNQQLGTALGPPSLATTFETLDLSTLHLGINTFYVVATLGDCSSFGSEPKNLRVDGVPDITAYAGEDFKTCGSKPFTLDAADPGDGTWTPLSGPSTIIVNPNNDKTLVTGASAGNVYRYIWTLSNGACKNYSSDTVQVTAVVPELAKAEPLQMTCDTITQLHATPGVNTSGTWTQLPGQAASGVVIDDPDSPNTTVRGLQPGQAYYFYWTLMDNGCVSPPAETKVISLSKKYEIGPDRDVCSIDGCATLIPQTTLLVDEMGLWSSENPALSFTPPNSVFGSQNTVVCNLQPGPNKIYWTTNNQPSCEGTRDTIILFFGQFPTAHDDDVTVISGSMDTIYVLANDETPTQVSVRIITPPLFGNFETIGMGIYTYQPNADHTGPDQFIYEICNASCVENACSRATVQIDVQEAAECKLPTLITPNGDNVNDKLVFNCIHKAGEGTGHGELTVFNQWGNEVYHAADYDNTWGGTYHEEDLPPGTYYYILKADYLAKPVSHFLIIQK